MDKTERSDREERVDEMIRRRFRFCESLPLFADPLPAGFFQFADIGSQMLLHDPWDSKHGQLP